MNVSVKDQLKQSRRWTLADAELENLPLPNLSERSSILSPAHMREVRRQPRYIHGICMGLKAQHQIYDPVCLRSLAAMKLRHFNDIHVSVCIFICLVLWWPWKLVSSVDSITVNCVAAWCSGNSICRINEVTLRRARLVLGWVACTGSTPGGGTLFRYVTSHAGRLSLSSFRGR